MRSTALPSLTLQHKTDFGFVLRYWRLQGTLRERTSRRRFLFPGGFSFLKHVASRSSAWAPPTSV
jgi:hypothetical protein